MYWLTDDCFDAVDFEELDEGEVTDMEVDTRLEPPPIVDFEDEAKVHTLVVVWPYMYV